MATRMDSDPQVRRFSKSIEPELVARARHRCILPPDGAARDLGPQGRLRPDQVVVWVVLRRTKLVCPKCAYSTMARENEQDHDSVWRQIDLGSGGSSSGRGCGGCDVPSMGCTWRASRSPATARGSRGTPGSGLLPADRLHNLFEIRSMRSRGARGHRYSRRSATTAKSAWRGAPRANGKPRRTSSSPRARPAARAVPAAASAARAGDHGPARPMPDRRGRRGHPRGLAPAPEHAPQAEIVIDNYHVVALATKARRGDRGWTAGRRARALRPVAGAPRSARRRNYSVRRAPQGARATERTS